MWGFIPLSQTKLLFNTGYGLLYIYAFSSLSVVAIILAGWSSISKYPLLGAIRTSAQIISYEVSIWLVFVCLALITQTIHFSGIVWFQGYYGITALFTPLLVPVLFVSILAELNRTPFDLPEAEAELVAGYNLEYSGILFAFFILAEYANILLIGSVFVAIFFGGSLIPKSFLTVLLWGIKLSVE